MRSGTWLRRIALGLAGFVIVVVLVMLAWYRVDGQPLGETQAYLAGEGYAVAKLDDGGLLFTPTKSNGHGLLIMHGALILPQSYANTAAFFATRGYTVYLPRGALRLSINAVDEAARRMAALPVGDWFVIGHSMGGFSSLTLIERHAPNVKAAALWAAAMPGDFRSVKVPLLFLWGDHDRLLPAERFADARSKLPASTRYLTLAGANHREFAMYSHQYFDGEGTLGWQAQIDRANRLSEVFFAESGGAPVQ